MQYMKKNNLLFNAALLRGCSFFIKNADLYDLRVELYDLRMLFHKKAVPLQALSEKNHIQICVCNPNCIKKHISQ